ncbi:excisionase family DNA binding protein [Frondihabitans sp. PhB188]|uniref:helix-turn-helix domain-containing protein n=1 Tax=Frondihabitans sp. PhB188 TaxID=2485200 RepID=UPI000FB31205|nr:helix-turn-helix domain-containing protein [Frondihabitans sp. PhB188]ROQ36801.1 excisionase family DNA binding protein [Frondihabitans sp. PhB188]
MPKTDPSVPFELDRLRAYSFAEVADRLGVSLKTVRRMVDSGDLKAFRPHTSGRTIRISETALRNLFDATN